MIDPALLRRLRNDLPMSFAVVTLGREGPLSKVIEGHFRFVCPGCGELRAAVNPRTNLAHCFACGKNTNNIDLLISLGHSFLHAVALLETWLEQYLTHHAKAKTSVSPRA